MIRSLPVCALVCALAASVGAQSPPTPATSTPSASAQAPAKSPPPQQQLYKLVPVETPIQPVQEPRLVAVPQPQYAVQAPQQAVYAVQQPIQQSAYTVTAQPPATIRIGGGLVSAALTGVGNCLTKLGSTTTTITLQRSRMVAIGQPALPSTTMYTTIAMPQPLQQVQYQVQVQQPPVQQVQLVQQPVQQQLFAVPRPPSEEAPPPPSVPQPSPQSNTPPKHRIGGLFGS